MTPASRPRAISIPTDRICAIPLALATIAIVGFFLVRTVSEYDIWYHMAVGKEILRTGAFPVTDQLSILNLGQPVHARLWLFRVVTTWGFQLAGFWWLQGVQVLIWGLTFWVVFRSLRQWTSLSGSWLLLLATALACTERFTIRPEIVTYLLIAVFYHRLQSSRYRSPVELAIFFLLQEVWTSSHGLFSIGPFLVFCYLAGSLVRGIRERNFGEAKSLGILFLVVAFGCLATPIGLDSIRYTWQLLATVAPQATLAQYRMFELAPPLGQVSRNFICYWFFLLLLVMVVVSLAGAALRNFRQLPLERIVIVAALLAVSLTGIRNMPIFAVVAAPFAAELLALQRTATSRRVSAGLIAGAMIIALCVWSPRPAIRNVLTWDRYRFGLGLSPDFVPLGLPAFLDRIGFAGPIFNSQTLGGFYEYYGAPRRIAFYDFRLEDYELRDIKRIFDITFEAVNHPAAWYDLAHRYDFRGLLLENASSGEAGGLLPLLATDRNWRLVYLDYAASFWLRSDQPSTAPPLGQEHIAALVAGIANQAQAENLNSFLDTTGLYPELRRSLLEQATARWDAVALMTDLAILKMKTGDLAGAESLFHRVLSYKPDSRVTLTTLAQLALYRGDRQGAAAYLRQALRYYPGDQELLENFRTVTTP